MNWTLNQMCCLVVSLWNVVLSFVVAFMEQVSLLPRLQGSSLPLSLIPHLLPSPSYLGPDHRHLSSVSCESMAKINKHAIRVTPCTSSAPAPPISSEEGQTGTKSVIECGFVSNGEENENVQRGNKQHTKGARLSGEGKRRTKKIIMACDFCRGKLLTLKYVVEATGFITNFMMPGRKIKCDGQKSCFNCTKRHIRCTYIPVQKRRGP